LLPLTSVSVVVTTTTKIWPPEGMPLVLQVDEPEFADRVAFELNSKPCVAVGSRIASGGKLVGLKPDEVCVLKNGAVADVVLCEADGAAGRSLKVHGPGEPVVPPCATAVAVVGGLDAIGELPGPGVIHRYDRFLDDGEADATASIDASTFAHILLRAAGKIARHVPIVFVLNKADDVNSRRDAGSVAYGFGLLSSAVTYEDFSARFHGNDERIDVESLRLTTQCWLDLCPSFLG